MQKYPYVDDTLLLGRYVDESVVQKEEVKGKERRGAFHSAYRRDPMSYFLVSVTYEIVSGH